MLSKKQLLKSKAKVVCTQMGHILFVLVIFLKREHVFAAFGYFYFASTLCNTNSCFSIFWCVHSHEHIPSLQRRVTTRAFATNRHTNPPSTRVSLPTDTAEHAPNFISPSTSEPSEVYIYINKQYGLKCALMTDDGQYKRREGMQLHISTRSSNVGTAAEECVHFHA